MIYNKKINYPKQLLIIRMPKVRFQLGGVSGPVYFVPELSFMTGLSDEQRANFNLMKSSLPDISGGLYEHLASSYSLTSEYLTRENIWCLLLSHPVPSKALSPGRVVLVNHGGKVNVLGLVLSVDNKGKQRSFLTLVLSSSVKSGETLNLEGETEGGRGGTSSWPWPSPL